MKKIVKNLSLIFLLSLGLGFLSCAGCDEEGDENGDGAVCGNGICENGEDENKCAKDCTDCGNGICGDKENEIKCARDCTVCGNGICGAKENESKCPDDCKIYQAVQVDGGAWHTCAVNSLGGIRCWGYNGDGQLGNGTKTDRKVPGDVSGLSSGGSAVAAGDSHSCALTSSGGVMCWGDNNSGALGNGTWTDSKVPVDVSGLSSGVIAISARGGVCALTTSGGVKCWGNGNSGSLGNGTFGWSNVPVDVTGLSSGVSAISTGGCSCAVLSTGALKCWGRNTYGQVGDGTTTNRNVPVDVFGLSSGVSAVSAGYDHTCALLSSGGLKCWGWNGYGQLGNNSFTTSKVPVDVSGLSSGVSAVSGGGAYLCASFFRRIKMLGLQ